MELPKNKICSRCKIPKDAEFFRIRTEKREGRTGVPFKFLNNTCKQCDSELMKERYQKIKNNLDFKQKTIEKSKEYREKNKEIIKERNKVKRQKPSYRENRKKYIKQNKDKIFKQESLCKKKYHEKNRDNLTDVYVGNKISNLFSIKREFIPQELIELKKAQILLIRQIKNNQ